MFLQDVFEPIADQQNVSQHHFPLRSPLLVLLGEMMRR